MAKYQNILVAVDGSETSLHALKQAFRLGGKVLTVLSVAPAYQGDLRLVGVAHPQALLTEPCGSALDKAQEMGEVAGVQVKTMCEIGEPHECIVEQAEAEDADLIVMGAKGLSFVTQALLGSVTRRVIGFTTRDVLVVPPEAPVGWGKVLLATDASEKGAAAADRALELAQTYSSELMVVAVREVPGQIFGEEATVVAEVKDKLPEHIEAVTKAAQSLKIRVKGQILEGTPYSNIVNCAQQEKAELIVMGSHGRTGLTRLLMGSVTERVIGHAPCPVLVVKGSEQ